MFEYLEELRVWPKSIFRRQRKSVPFRVYTISTVMLMAIHHRDTEDTEGAQRKTISNYRFDISNSESEISNLRASSVFSVSLW